MSSVQIIVTPVEASKKSQFPEVTKILSGDETTISGNVTKPNDNPQTKQPKVQATNKVVADQSTEEIVKNNP